MKKYWDLLISKIDTPVWLEVFFVILILLRIPSFFEPYYYGDEMIYMALGEGIRQGVPLYSGLHDNKPPLLYLTAAISGNLFMFKALLAVASLLSAYLFWKLTKNLFPDKNRLQMVSTILFGIFTTLPLLEGNIANAENFMMVFTLIAMNLVYKYKDNFGKVFLAGFLLSIASLYKIVAAFDIFAVLAFWFIFTSKKEWLNLVKKIVYLSLGFIIPIGFTFVWYYFSGSIKEYVVAAYLQNIGYVSSWRPSDVQKPFLERNAPLLIRFAVMIVGFVVLWLKRNKLSKQFIFVSAWLLATLFAVTLSERPYPHYLLQSVAPAAILFGMLFTVKNIEQVLVIIPLTLFFFVPFYFKFWHYSSIKYYKNFVLFATGQVNKDQYFKNFSSRIPDNYELSKYLAVSAQKGDRVFVWGNDSSAIYTLSKRLPPMKYVADYHYRDFSSKDEVLQNLSESFPKFIVITPNSFEFNELEEFVMANYYLIDNVGSSQIWLYIKK